MKFERLLLSILASLPLKSVAFAAESRLITMAGEGANSGRLREALTLKSKLFKPFQMVTSIDQAFSHFRASMTSPHELSEVEAKAEFNVLVEKMLQEGLIETNEKFFQSKVNSGIGG